MLHRLDKVVSECADSHPGGVGQERAAGKLLKAKASLVFFDPVLAVGAVLAEKNQVCSLALHVCDDGVV